MHTKRTFTAKPVTMTRILPFLSALLLGWSAWSCQPEADEPFHSFWLEFQTALEANEPEKLAPYIYFPLRGAPLVLGTNKAVMTKEEYVAQFEKLFDEQTRQKLLSMYSGELEPYVVQEGTFAQLMGIPSGYTVYKAKLEFGQGVRHNFHFSPHDDSFKLHIVDPKK